MITIEEFKKKNTNKVRLLGLDLGSKNIGVSICDENQSIATPYKTIIKNTNNDLVNNLKEIIDDNNIKGIIIGNPINMDGSTGRSAQSSMDFANNLSNNVTIPITFWDERLSSEAAFKMTKDLNTNVTNKIKNLDKNSAAFILQGAIDYLNN